MTTLLDLIGMIEPDLPHTASNAERAAEFDRLNPRVYAELRRLSFVLVNRGHKHFGVKMIFEQMRWQWYERTADVSGFKLNNNYTAYFARKLMAEEPSLRGVFNLRTVHDQRAILVRKKAS